MSKVFNQLRYIKNIGQVWRILTSKVKSIEIAVNYLCNKKCPGCYARNLRAEQNSIFLGPKEIKEICDKHKPAHINLTGGEPMLNPDIFEIIKIIPKSTIVSLVTNGDIFKYCLNRDGAKLLKDYISSLKYGGLNTLQISYGSNYNMKFNETLALRAKQAGLNVCFSVTNIYKERKHILKAIKLCEKYKVQLLFNTPGCGLEDQFDYMTYFTYRRHPLVREDNLFWAGKDICPAGIQKFYITADKSIYPCDRMQDKKFNSYEEMRRHFKKEKKVQCRRYEV